MNLSRFFIDRPIAAVVLSAMIVIAGALSLGGLPLTEYPQVTPPTVVVRAMYPGANPKVIAETVAIYQSGQFDVGSIRSSESTSRSLISPNGSSQRFGRDMAISSSGICGLPQRSQRSQRVKRFER